MGGVEDGVLTVPGDATCAEVEAHVRPWLFASDRPDLTVRAWIDRGGGDLLWGLLGPTRSQVLGVAVELADGRVARFGGRVVKNVAGYDLSRAIQFHWAGDGDHDLGPRGGSGLTRKGNLAAAADAVAAFAKSLAG